MTWVPGGVGREDGERPGRRLELGEDDHPNVERASAAWQLVRLPADDREAAQERGALGEAQHGRHGPAHVLALERLRRRGGVDVPVAQRRGQTGRHISTPPASRRLLETHYVGVQGAEPVGGVPQAVLERFVVPGQLREDAAVEQVERHEADRQRRRVEVRRDACRAPDDPERRAGDQQAADLDHGPPVDGGTPRTGAGHAIVNPIATAPGFSRCSAGAPGAIHELRPRRPRLVVVAAGSRKTGS